MLLTKPMHRISRRVFFISLAGTAGAAVLAACASSGNKGAQLTKHSFTVHDGKTWLDDQPILVKGLRCSNALVNDEAAASLIDHLDEFASYGVNTVSVFLMGSRFGDIKGYHEDASLDPVIAARLGKIIEAADQRAMVVLVGVLYWSVSLAKWDSWTQTEANLAVKNTVQWLKANDYRNVFVDVDNEGMARVAVGFDNREMVLAGKTVDQTIPIATNFRGLPPLEADLGIHFSEVAPGKPYIETEGSPSITPDSKGYWGPYSKTDGLYGYIHVGVYTPEMIQNQLEITRKHLDHGQGYLLASTWLQAAPPQGPNHLPGGMGTQEDPGVLWWLEWLRDNYGPYRPGAGLWSQFEGKVENQTSYGDPYLDVDLRVSYTRPDGSQIEFWGFYDGGATWRFRCMPDQLGEWRYQAVFSDGTPAAEGTFTCFPSEIPGMVSVAAANPLWFGYKSGQHLLARSLHVGDRFFASNFDEADRNRFLDWAQQQGYNLLSIASHYQNRADAGRGAGWETPRLWPLNSSEFRKMERILNDLAHRGLLVFPFAGFFGRKANSPSDPAEQEQYIRYTLARLGAYWNVLFNVAGPEPLHSDIPYLSKADLDRLGQKISSLDVFDHLLTVHNKTGDDDFINDAWITFGTLQGPKTTNLADLYAGLLRNARPGRPLYAQETLWSGNKYHPNYSDSQLRQNAWVLLMAAATINFADNGGPQPDTTGDSSTGFSGTLALADCRQARHAILKQVWDTFECFAFEQMKPHPELVSAGFCLAEPGQCYLVYLPAPAKLDLTLATGTYQAEWINPNHPTDRAAAGPLADGKGLQPPQHGEDWLLYVTRVTTP